MATSHTVLDHPIVAAPSFHHMEFPGRPKSIRKLTGPPPLPRSASYTYIPALLDSSAVDGHGADAEGRPSSKPAAPTNPAATGSPKASKRAVDRQYGRVSVSGIIRSVVTTRIEKSEVSRQAEDPQEHIPNDSNIGRSAPPETDASLALKEDGSTKDGASSEGALSGTTHGESRGVRSRSSSPSDSETSVLDPDDAKATSQPSSPATSQVSLTSEPGTIAPGKNARGELRPKRRSMRRSVLGLKTPRSLTNLLKPAIPGSEVVRATPSQSIPTSLSTDVLPSLMKTLPAERIPPVPRPKSSYSLQGLTRAVPHKKDELWSVFRGLDSDFHKFQAKTSALKANLVRSSLLPFLRNYAHHPSNVGLRPEDLDRRAAILNKWWTVLLEMVDGGSNYTLSATDRPIILDGITGIMTRPEWRSAPSSFAPLLEQHAHRGLATRSDSTTSLDSTGSDFLVESVHHNVRNIFVQNLMLQTSIVIHKLSLRNAPASLVTFAGKALAYSFYFCPGVAEVLVRLWALPANNLRYVADELGLLGRRPHANAGNGTSGFPPCLHPLHFDTIASTVRFLRRSTTPVVHTPTIDWHGPWLTRWSGRDSDLLFVFVKQWHILLEEFLPSDATHEERICSPAFVLVYAQMMTVFHSTIYRPPGPAPVASSEASPATTFDDVLASADASADALPLRAGNLMRLMAENRLIMLLRDMLSDKSSEHERASRTLATYFGKMLQAAARRISMFDADACFTLCDFLEEAVYIFARYQAANPLVPDVVDWDFWLEVCKRISESRNTMSEIRLFALLYGSWGIVVSDERRKRKLCLGWLLTQETFDQFFCHWCPMSRAYYMRLLCWRVSRCTGEASELNEKILTTLMHRLRGVWSRVQLLSKAAQEHNAMPPTITPSPPAPSRRLIILRNDSQVPASQFLTFDGLSSRSSSSLLAGSRRDSFLLSPHLNELDHGKAGVSSPVAGATEKKRWGFFRTIKGFGNPDSGTTTTLKENESPPEKRLLRRVSRDSLRESGLVGAASGPTNNLDHGSTTLTRNASSSVRSSFRFSLEWVDKDSNVVRGGRRLYPPKLPLPAQNLLRTAVPSVPEEGPPLPRLELNGTKYVGRALSEWALVVNECQVFFERRKSEGVSSDALVETPTLGVDWFRKSG